MSIFEIIILNAIFILFPNFLYTLYVTNKKNLKEKESKIFFDICMLLSLFLVINYSTLYNQNYLIVFMLTIFLFSYINNRIISSIITSSIIFEYLCDIYSANPFVLFCGFSILFILYFVFNKNKKILFTFSFLVSIIFIIYCNDLIIPKIIVYSIIICILLIWNKKVKEIFELQNSLKNFKTEKELKISLFKIVHEIKNPLTVIKGYLSLIDFEKTTKAKKYINILKSETERTVNILDDFMQFSKIDIKKEIFDYNLFIKTVEDILVPLLNSKNIHYNFVTEKNIMINADYNRIKQVVVNILKNSIEACNLEGKILVSSFINNNKLNIIVEDNGCGMDKYVLEQIKNPFFTTKEKGTGLGVCLSREIIESHKGKLVYKSTVSKGTTVKIILPIN